MTPRPGRAGRHGALVSMRAFTDPGGLGVHRDDRALLDALVASGVEAEVCTWDDSRHWAADSLVVVRRPYGAAGRLAAYLTSLLD